MPGKKMVCGNGCNSAAIIQGAGAAAEATIVGTAWDPSSPAAEQFVMKYKAKYSKDPDQFAAQAYSAMLVLADALKRSSNATDHAGLKKALEGVQALKTPLGGFSFTPDHDVAQTVYVMTVKGNAFVPFK
jgi:branched-chain amino acid transport system substrate-binding protein